MNGIIHDKVYERNLAEAESLIKKLHRHQVSTDCYSARKSVSPSGLATEDCDFAIDFKEGYKERVESMMKQYTTGSWRIESIPNYMAGLLRLKVNLQPQPEPTH